MAGVHIITAVTQTLNGKTFLQLAVLTTAIAFIVKLLGRALRGSDKTKRIGLPVYHVTMGTDAAKVIKEAHKECPDKPFVLSQFGMDAVILPTSEIETVKSLPESQLSIKHHHYNVFLGEYSYMGTKADEFDAAMRHILVRNTPVILESFTAEVEYAMQNFIGQCVDWSPIRVRDSMSKVASIMSGRAFVGLPLSRDPDWVASTTSYTQDVSRAYIYLRSLSWLTKPVLAPFSTEVKSLLGHRTTTAEKLAPLLAAKQKKISSEKHNQQQFEAKVNNPPGGEMLDWFISRYSKPPSPQQLARDQLLATFASIYNLSNALSYVVFDLAAYPEHVDELRQELRNVLGDDGTIDKSSLPKLRKLDSFVRESQRMSPPSIANIPRYVTSPSGFRTSTGHVIPQGHTVMVRADAINLDPNIWENPEKFDGFRFAKLRQRPGAELKFQHTSTGTDNINFGHGIWACPGRFFASAEIKVVVAYLITHYEMKLMPGKAKPGTFHYGFAILPDSEAEILFKHRN